MGWSTLQKFSSGNDHWSIEKNYLGPDHDEYHVFYFKGDADKATEIHDLEADNESQARIEGEALIKKLSNGKMKKESVDAGDHFLLFEEWNTKINEDTIEGYEYHFTFEGDEYTIDQGEKDKTIFGIKKKNGDWLVMTKGRLFDPAAHDKTRNEMVKFLQEGIKFFNIRNPVEVDTVKESEWAKFFDFEIRKRPGRINKKYVVLKLHCGKASAKWLSKH